jgi:rubrerythrin
MENEEYYIEDNDLVDLLKDVLGDKITDEDIQRILDASDDGELSEEDFDNIVDEILARSKKGAATRKPEPIIPSEISDEKEYVYLSNSPDTCPVCGSSLLNENYCPVCNLKFSFDK